MQVLDFLRRQLLAHLQVKVLPNEAHSHDGLGNAGEAQLLAINGARVGHEDGHGHFLGLVSVLGQLELEHLALVAQIDLFLLGLVGEREAGDEGPRRLGLDVEEEVALGVKTNFFLPGVEVGVERVHEENFVPNFLVIRETEVEVDLFVVFPDFTLLVGLLHLIVALVGLRFVFLVLGRSLLAQCVAAFSALDLHLNL